MMTNQAILVEEDRIKEIGDVATLASHAPDYAVSQIGRAETVKDLNDPN
jgi:hypothetical protein